MSPVSSAGVNADTNAVPLAENTVNQTRCHIAGPPGPI